MIEEPYELRAGDSFKTSCMYNNQDVETVFGKGSKDEMCIHLMMYYPRRYVGSSPFICGPGMPIGEPTECEGTYSRVEENEVIQNSMDFVRPFGVPASVCHVMEELEPQKEEEEEEQVDAQNNNATAAVTQKPTTQTNGTAVPPKATQSNPAAVPKNGTAVASNA